jgi:transposase
MHFVAVKSEAAEGAAVVFRTRDMLVRQRTQIINALRGHLAEFGLVVAEGPAHVAKLIAAVQDLEQPLPEVARLRWRLFQESGRIGIYSARLPDY